MISFSSSMNSMFVDFDKPYYYPGDTVMGHIYLNVCTVFPAAGVEMVIKTKEYVRFKDTEFQTVKRERRNPQTGAMEMVDERELVTVTREEKKTLFRNKTFIPVWQSQMISMGQFAFPFSFKVPDNLPGSFEYYDTDVAAVISYTVKSKIVNITNKNDKMKFFNIIIVRQNEKMLNVDKSLHSNKPLTVWGCCNKGAVTFDVSYPKNFFFPGEHVQVFMKLDNTQSMLNATALNLTVSQDITLRKGPHSKTINRNIGERTWQELIAIGQVKETTIDIEIKDENNPTMRFLNKSKHYKLFKDESIVSKLQASCTGRNITCKYSIHAFATYEGCCPSAPHFNIPILLYIPENTNPVQFAMPSGWNPQVMDNVSVSFNSEDFKVEESIIPDIGLSVGLNMPTMDIGVGVSGPSVNVNVPSVNVDPPKVKFGLPKLSVGLPKVNIGMPNVHVGVPSVNVGMPNVHVGVPSVNVGMPNVHVGVPSVNVGMPNVHVGVPSVNVGMPSVNVGMPSVNVGMPSVNVGMPNMSVGLNTNVNLGGGVNVGLGHHGSIGVDVDVDMPNVSVGVPGVNVSTGFGSSSINMNVGGMNMSGDLKVPLMK